MLQKSTSFSFKIFDQKIIKALLNIVEEQSSPQQDISTDSNRLKCFTSKSKLWDYPRLNFDDYLSLKSYYVDMVGKYGDSSGIFFLYFRL